METSSEKIKNLSKAVMFLFISMSVIIFCWNYGFTDWEQISDEVSGYKAYSNIMFL